MTIGRTIAKTKFQCASATFNSSVSRWYRFFRFKKRLASAQNVASCLFYPINSHWDSTQCNPPSHLYTFFTFFKVASNNDGFWVILTKNELSTWTKLAANCRFSHSMDCSQCHATLPAALQRKNEAVRPFNVKNDANNAIGNVKPWFKRFNIALEIETEDKKNLSSSFIIVN